MTLNLNTIGKTFARNTTVLVKEVDLTATDAAKLTGVSRRTLGRIATARRERRPYNPTLRTLAKLSQTFGVTLDDFVKTSV